MNPLNLPGSQFLLFYSVVAIAALLAVWAVRRAARGEAVAGPARPADLDPYELAYLADGPNRAVQAALVSLAGRGAVVASKRGVLSVDHFAGKPTDPVETAVHRAIRQQAPARFAGVVQRCWATLDPIDDRLAGAGLLVPAGTRRAVVLLAVGLTAGVLALGVAKIVVGVGRDKPVGFLVVLCLAAVVGMCVVTARPLRRTVLGDAVFDAHVRRNRRLTSDTTARAGDQLMLGVALFGTGLLADTALADFRDPLRPRADAGFSNGWGGDGGSGDSGGGSSCGGGGCGGCGS